MKTLPSGMLCEWRYARTRAGQDMAAHASPRTTRLYDRAKRADHAGAGGENPTAISEVPAAKIKKYAAARIPDDIWNNPNS
jgi:hypothetical protein